MEQSMLKIIVCLKMDNGGENKMTTTTAAYITLIFFFLTVVVLFGYEKMYNNYKKGMK